MKQINSVLLPGEFFKNNFKEKTEKLMSIDIDTCYLFDHGVNPASKDLDVYEFIDGIYKLNEVIDGQFRLGLCVLNINARPYKELFEQYIYKLLEIKNFKLGIGTGDDKFEKRPNFQNDIEKIIPLVSKLGKQLDDATKLNIDSTAGVLYREDGLKWASIGGASVTGVDTDVPLKLAPAVSEDAFLLINTAEKIDSRKNLSLIHI